jgi:hypothetical protein
MWIDEEEQIGSPWSRSSSCPLEVAWCASTGADETTCAQLGQSFQDSTAGWGHDETVLPSPIPWQSWFGRLDARRSMSPSPSQTPERLSQSGLYPVQRSYKQEAKQHCFLYVRLFKIISTVPAQAARRASQGS